MKYIVFLACVACGGSPFSAGELAAPVAGDELAPVLEHDAGDVRTYPGTSQVDATWVDAGDELAPVLEHDAGDELAPELDAAPKAFDVVDAPAPLVDTGRPLWCDDNIGPFCPYGLTACPNSTNCCSDPCLCDSTCH